MPSSRSSAAHASAPASAALRGLWSPSPPPSPSPASTTPPVSVRSTPPAWSSFFVTFRFALLLSSFNFLSGLLSVSACYSGRWFYVAEKQGNAGLKAWVGAVQRRRRGRTVRPIVLFILQMETTWRCCHGSSVSSLSLMLQIDWLAVHS